MRIVVAPKNAIDADDVASVYIRWTREARAVPTVSLGVEARQLYEWRVVRRIDFTDRAHLPSEIHSVHILHDLRSPSTAALRQDELEAREALEYAAHNERRVAALDIKRHFESPERV